MHVLWLSGFVFIYPLKYHQLRGGGLTWTIFGVCPAAVWTALKTCMYLPFYACIYSIKPEYYLRLCCFCMRREREIKSRSRNVTYSILETKA
jgi:hypothetical protein